MLIESGPQDIDLEALRPAPQDPTRRRAGLLARECGLLVAAMAGRRPGTDDARRYTSIDVRAPGKHLYREYERPLSREGWQSLRLRLLVARRDRDARERAWRGVGEARRGDLVGGPGHLGKRVAAAEAKAAMCRQLAREMVA